MNDQPPFDATIEKARAEIEQIRAFTDLRVSEVKSNIAKQDAEVSSLFAPFYLRSSFWTTVVPVLTAAVTAIYYLNNQFDSNYADLKNQLQEARTAELNAKAELADNKNSQIAAQIEESKKQLSILEGEMAQSKQENSDLKLKIEAQNNEFAEKSKDAEIYRLIGVIVDRAKRAFPDTNWDEQVHGQLVTLVKDEARSQEILEKAASNEPSPATQAQLEMIGFRATGDTEWLDRIMKLGDNGVAAGIEDYNFWTLFNFRVLGAEVLDPVVVARGCDLLWRSFVASFGGTTSTGVPDVIALAVKSCETEPSSGPSVWGKVAEAAAGRLLGSPMTYAWNAQTYAEFVAKANQYAAALLFAESWSGANFDESWLSYAQSLVDQWGTSTTWAPRPDGSVADWEAFLRNNLTDVAKIKGSPLDSWPKR